MFVDLTMRSISWFYCSFGSLLISANGQGALLYSHREHVL